MHICYIKNKNQILILNKQHAGKNFIFIPQTSQRNELGVSHFHWTIFRAVFTWFQSYLRKANQMIQKQIKLLTRSNAGLKRAVLLVNVYVTLYSFFNLNFYTPSKEATIKRIPQKKILSKSKQSLCKMLVKNQLYFLVNVRDEGLRLY